jgi:hypothetical protein
LEIQDLPLRATDDGRTLIDKENGWVAHCATAWQDQAAIESRLVEILHA